MRRRPKIRKLIDKWSRNEDRLPTYIDEGYVFMFPASAPVDGYHVVVWFPYHYGRPQAFVCSCHAFRYSTDDECKHVRQMKEEIIAARYDAESISAGATDQAQ